MGRASVADPFWHVTEHVEGCAALFFGRECDCPTRRFVDVAALLAAAEEIEVWTTVWHDEEIEDGQTKRMPTSYAREAPEVITEALERVSALNPDGQHGRRDP